MTTIQNKSTVQNTQDFITIQDLFYLCLNKWHWFVISLVLCLGVATFYLLRTPSVYVRTASILIKDDSKGKSSSADMESFSDLGLFKTNTNVYNEIGTLQSPDIMREVVSRLHLEMNYQTDGRSINRRYTEINFLSRCRFLIFQRMNPPLSNFIWQKTVQWNYPLLHGMEQK